MKIFLSRRNIVLLVIIALLGGLFLWNRNRVKNGIEQVLTEVNRGNIIAETSFPGKIESERKAVLNFATIGKAGYVNVKEGDTVSRGQLLAGLDIRDLGAAETAAYYKYLAADANAKKIEDDLKGKDTTETFTEKNTRVAAQTARDAAYDAWQTARRATFNGNLTAPFAGVVTEMTFQAIGDTVGVTDGVTVVDPENLYFEIEVDEADFAQIEVGEGVKVVLDAFPEDEFPGYVSLIGFQTRLSSSGATVVPIKVTLAEDSRLRLGLNGDAMIELGRAENTLYLPYEAVIDGEVTLPGGEKKKVETGLETDTDIEIKAGLNEGEKVVVK